MGVTVFDGVSLLMYHPLYIKFQYTCRSIVTEKFQCLKIMKKHGKDYRCEQTVFYGLRKAMIPRQSS